MSRAARRGISKARLLVIAAVLGAVLFGALLAYLAYSNDSFPVRQKPFVEYASVTSSTFNGTEYAFEVRWVSPAFLPLFAQLTSPSSDAANTPVCGLGLNSVVAGQTIFMPFRITPTASGLTNVDLSIAVRSITNGTEFTIVYAVASVSASPGKISPSNISCEQPPGVE